MSFVRLGCDTPGFTHIQSFRRQIFIDPTDIDKLPKEFTVNYEDTVYHIYASTDKISCFICHQEGHTQKYCKSATNNTPDKNVNNNILLPTQKPTGSENAFVADSQVPQVYETNSTDMGPQISNVADKQNAFVFNGAKLFMKPNLPEKSKTNKRAIIGNSGSIASTADDMKSESSQADSTLITQKERKKKKKLNTEKFPPSDLETEIQIAKINIPETTASIFPISYESLYDFLCKTYEYKISEAPLLAAEVVENSDSLVIMLQEVYKHISRSDVKKRITRIVNNLQNSPDFSTDEAYEEDHNQGSTP